MHSSLKSIFSSQDDSADVIGERGASAVIATQHSGGTATLFFNRNGPEPEARPVYSVSVSSGDAMPELRACTEGVPGCHDPCPSPDGRWLASVHSDDVTCASPHSYSIRLLHGKRFLKMRCGQAARAVPL